MTDTARADTSAALEDDGETVVDTSAMTQEEIIAHNLKVVEAHFHNENPESVDAAISLYGPEIVWEAPFRGQIYTDPASIKAAYLQVFDTVHFNRSTTLRRFATEQFVFDDQILDCTVVGEGMPNLGFHPGSDSACVSCTASR